jgi:hypothetical protein
MLLAVLGAGGASLGAYVAIRADLARLHERVDGAVAAVTRAHERIDTFHKNHTA